MHKSNLKQTSHNDVTYYQGVEHERHRERGPGVLGVAQLWEEDHARVVVHVERGDLPELVPQHHEHGVQQLDYLLSKENRQVYYILFN